MKETFKVTIDDKELELAVVKPSVKILQEAQLHYNRAYAEAIKSGALLRSVLEAHMKKQGLWDEDRQKEYQTLVDEVADGEKKLQSKGKLRLGEAKKVALAMQKSRWKIRNMFADITETHVNSAEGQAEQSKFNFLVSRCLVYNDSGEPYFKSVDEYLEHSGEAIALMGASIFGKIYYGVDSQLNLPENKFLLRYKFVDENLRLIDSEGRLVDEDGNLLEDVADAPEELGEFLDDNGNPIKD